MLGVGIVGTGIMTKIHAAALAGYHRSAVVTADISAGNTLEPGDVMGTGTPDGIGPAEHGDFMDVSVEGLGTLRAPDAFAAQQVPAGVPT